MGQDLVPIPDAVGAQLADGLQGVLGTLDETVGVLHHTDPVFIGGSELGGVLEDVLHAVP
jgi:hypothetical protein